MYRVITLARDFGSGGGAIARSVAELIGWKLLADSGLTSGAASWALSCFHPDRRQDSPPHPGADTCCACGCRSKACRTSWSARNSRPTPGTRLLPGALWGACPRKEGWFHQRTARDRMPEPRRCRPSYGRSAQSPPVPGETHRRVRTGPYRFTSSKSLHGVRPDAAPAVFLPVVTLPRSATESRVLQLRLRSPL